MGTKFILPINEHPSVSTCIHHAYPIAIIEARELVRIQVENFNKYEWKFLDEHARYLIDDDEISICQLGAGEITTGGFWRSCSNVDEIVLNIEYLRPSDLKR